MAKAVILLEDGRHFTGTSFAAAGERDGEMVFNTSMTGYQEIITDPSCKGQILNMTYPLIGNYGVNEEDLESDRPKVEGLVVKECCRTPSSWRATMPLGEYLSEHGVVGIEGVDTRAVTLHLRSRGAMRAIISTEDTDLASLKDRLERAPGILGRDLVREVTCREPYVWRDAAAPPGAPRAGERPLHVVAVDCGIKRSTLRILASLGCEVTVVPASTRAVKVLEMAADGILVSDGPGDPQGAPYLVEEVGKLLTVKPVLGLGLGQLVLGLAMGGRTSKLKFGHHGANHPVKDLRSGRVLITTQNHGFSMDPETLPEAVEPTSVNLNDRTLEGLRHRIYPVYAVQYQPKGSGGPHDAALLFGDFIRAMRARRGDSRA